MALFHPADLPGIEYFNFALIAGYVIVFGSAIGYLIYFFLRKRKK
jgi:hypothetical protein